MYCRGYYARFVTITLPAALPRLAPDKPDCTRSRVGCNRRHVPGLLAALLRPHYGQRFSSRQRYGGPVSGPRRRGREGKAGNEKRVANLACAVLPMELYELASWVRVG